MHLMAPVAIIGVACAFCMAAPPLRSAEKDCHEFAVTADSDTKEKALERAQMGLESTIAKWRFEQGWRSGWRSEKVSIEAHQPEPEPYWRFRVRPELFLKPDVETDTSYTVCWEGVISKAVCTSGAKVCK